MMKNLLNLLIVCGVLCQIILKSIADEDIRKPSEVLVRQKRVFHTNGSRDVSLPIDSTPYIVNIKTRNGQRETSVCVGVILTAHAIITAAKCARVGIQQYSVYSGTTYTNGGTHHRVIGKRIRISRNFENVPFRREDGVALMFVEPSFAFSRSTGTIAIHRAPLRLHATGTITGWGYRCGLTLMVPGPVVHLRSITVRTLTNIDCDVRWEGVMNISANDICTFDGERHCGHSDIGAPLVMNNQLVGIHLFSGGLMPGVEGRPDIFALLRDPEYFYWIVANIAHRN